MKSLNAKPRRFSRRSASHLIALAMVGSLVFCGGCDSAPSPGATTRPSDVAAEAPRPVTVAVDRVQLTDLPISIPLSGSLFGDEQATISAKVGGRIEQVSADVGDRVGPGAVLAQIDPTDYQIELEQKRLAVKEALAKLGLDEIPDSSFDPAMIATVERSRFQRDNAKAKVDRAATLMKADPPAMSAQEFADMQTAYEVAKRDFDVALLETKAQLAMARSRESEARAAERTLADATVRSPSQPADAPADHFAVAARLVTAGEMVSPGTAMFRLVADRPVKFRGSVPERFAGQVIAGQSATLQIEGLAPAVGKVSRVSPSIDAASRTFEVEILTENADRRIRPGAFARASILVGMRKQVSLVPQRALVSFAGIDRVFTVRDGKATGIRVTPIEKVGDRVALADPLPADTPIILRGDRGVAEGVAVQIGEVPDLAATTAPSRN